MAVIVRSDGPHHGAYSCSTTSITVYKMALEKVVERDNEALFVGVYSGHGGSAVSNLCAKELHKDLETRMNRLNKTFGIASAQKSGSTSSPFRQGLYDSFETMHRKVSEEMGSSAIVALIYPDRIVVANAGNCRCVLSRNKVSVELSRDHSPELSTERERIEAGNGYVDKGRVYLSKGSDVSLEVSRGIGFRLKSKQLTIDHYFSSDKKNGGSCMGKDHNPKENMRNMNQPRGLGCMMGDESWSDDDNDMAYFWRRRPGNRCTRRSYGPLERYLEERTGKRINDIDLDDHRDRLYRRKRCNTSTADSPCSTPMSLALGDKDYFHEPRLQANMEISKDSLYRIPPGRLGPIPETFSRRGKNELAIVPVKEKDEPMAAAIKWSTESAETGAKTGTKANLIICEPEVVEVDVEESDEFLVIGSNGIWDAMSSQEVIDFVGEKMLHQAALSDVCSQLVKKCLERKPLSKDAMNVVIVKLC